LEEVLALPGGNEIVTDQVLYNLKRRGIEWDLLPFCRAQHLPVMAYSPIEHSGRTQKRMLDDPTLQSIASRHDATPAQIALAWLIQQEVVVIPKASTSEHVRENHEALRLVLSEAELSELDQAFPPPARKIPLEVK
ncbi:MAG: hypothetical protein QOI34_1273, partial [Verrucomicrobiota bacterium]